ncbi:acetylornithine transaminase [Methanococcus maripaludis]|jgi:acetylornithine/N-succinyldiaminopimelate aminotransferase|uniref:Acetylornithine aminotransferase n=2 Tax=Methanococcus maripaludis TaxID=39152 RepID=A0A2Z5PLA1_METMI|nr:acetylornithine transaminase [Methanococcus maripaludis]AEK20129.1 acetylornithine aminotransferase [Methanococcus maripaludis X1]BAP63295.1 acetylornithine/succinyldiaminopimelate aminotransferase [Methanococcus maripaludis OS7]
MSTLEKEQIISDEKKYVIGTYGRVPVVLVKGNGMSVFDTDGKEYLDFLAGIGVNNVGHCHPKVVEAIKNQAETLIHVSNIYYNVPQIELAKKLVNLSGLDKAFFCNSGAEANEAAIKLARKYAKANGKEGEIITMEHAFHGRTLTTITATPKAKYQEGFEPLPTGFKYIPFNDIDALKAGISEKTSAIMIEPVQGEGGIHPADKEYLKAVRKLCDENNIVLIFDEVQCGMGRTGTVFSYEQYGVIPDIVTLAKGLGGGFPIGAMVAKSEIASAFTPGSHGTTFGGNPLACASSAAALDVISTLLDNAVEMGKYFKNSLKTLEEKYEFVKEVRSLGLMVGVELTFNGSEIVSKMFEKGFLINCTSDTVLRFLPPLIVEKEHIDAMISALDEVFSEI